MAKLLKSTDKNYVEVVADLKGETDKAIRVNDGSVEVWIPKSQLEDEYEVISGTTIQFVVPEWLGIEKGLI